MFGSEKNLLKRMKQGLLAQAHSQAGAWEREGVTNPRKLLCHKGVAGPSGLKPISADFTNPSLKAGVNHWILEQRRYGSHRRTVHHKP